MTICYFTATGNSLYVARWIGGTLLSIPQLMRQETVTIEDDAVGIVCPCYNCEMPMMVLEFMRKARIRTNYFFFIFTYGSGLGEAYTYAKLAAREAGLKLCYVNAVLMVNNFIPFYDIQEQLDTLPEKKVEEQLQKICDDLSLKVTIDSKITVSMKAQMDMYHKNLAEPWLRKDTALSYTVSNSCTHCGTCAMVCPANNISVTTEGVRFSNHCEVCYACLHHCPHNAIHMKQEAGTRRFRNEHISLSDIIEANQ